uniref:Uncharacterized protein n=1 Tax=Aegilops tauschii TaxID=37682 RepID=N1R3M4_AEGTA
MHAPPKVERALARHRGEDARERERVRPYPLGAHPEEERHGVRVRAALGVTAATAEGRAGTGMEDEEEGPAWVELEPISGEEQLDRALAEAQQRGVPIVVFW